MASKETLKKKLASLLQEDSLDSDQLIHLSHQLAELDQDSIRFSIDAGVIDRLGQELVARQETAVSELVKNAYDADARECELTFIDSDEVGGTLIIDDDGDGMTRDELVKGFMRISSTSKVHNPISRNYKRQRAGQKGIGRFSVQRLGTSLTIITQVEHVEAALELNINWDTYKNDTNLLIISNKLKEVEKVKSKGTRVIIHGLRDKWSKASIKRVYRYVLSIIQPFSLSEVIKISEEDESYDPGFKAVFYKKNDSSEKEAVADQTSMVYRHAVAEIEGYIDDTGIGVYTVDSKKLGISEVGEIGNDPDDNSIPFSELSNIRFKAFYFIYDSDLISKMHSTSIKRQASKEGGIRLYRNGFRVLPYGESGDDWLELDKSVRRRSILPPHSNLNFFGFVEIKDKDNLYNETSSREGLIENSAFIQLRNFVYRTLMTGVLKVASERNIKLTPSQKRDSETGHYEEVDIRIKNIAMTLEDLDKELDDEDLGIEAKKKRKRKVKKVKEALEEIEALQKAEIKRTIKERSMLRVLSSVGLTVAQFIHEIKHYMTYIRSDISSLIKDLEGEEKALRRLRVLESNFNSFHDYTSYFNDVVSQNVIRDIKPQNMRYIVKKFISSLSSDADKSGICFLEPVFNSNMLFTKSMHPSEWSSILFNFYTNSKKAIKRAQVDGKILIECGESDEVIYLEFSDNGDGIDKENEEKVFEEFFTTTSSNSLAELDQNSEIIGTGLGLKITSDIVRGYRGSVFVASPKEDFSTCLRVEIGKASEKEIEEHDL